MTTPGPFANAVRSGVQSPALDPLSLNNLQRDLVTDTAALIATIARQVGEQVTMPAVLELIDKTPRRIVHHTIVEHRAPRVYHPFTWVGVLIGALVGLAVSLLITTQVNAHAIMDAVNNRVLTVSSAFDSLWVEVPFIILLMAAGAAAGGFIGSLWQHELTDARVIEDNQRELKPNEVEV
jgi:uncharacterized protein YcfJ